MPLAGEGVFHTKGKSPAGRRRPTFALVINQSAEPHYRTGPVFVFELKASPDEHV